MKKLSFAALALALASTFAVGCAAPEADVETEEEGDTSSLIVNGSVDQGHPAVVFIQWIVTPAGKEAELHSCTGTVIGPRTVLTAGHCVTPAQPTDKLSNYKVKFGTNGKTSTDEIAVSAVLPHPNYNRAVAGNYDVGILRLAEPTDVKPVRIAQVITNMQGKTVTHVGYGRTNAADPKSAGTKKTVDLPVTMQTGHVLQTGNGKSGICMGDSGGPMFSVNGQTKETLIVAVHSYVSDGSTCLGKGYSTRTDTVKDFILANTK